MFAIILIVLVSVAVLALLTFEIVGLIRQIKERKKNKGKLDSSNPTLMANEETLENTENKEE